MKQDIYKVASNIQLVPQIFKMTLLGDTSAIKNPGQFINIKLNEFFLRRPISVYDYSDGKIEIIYKVVGDGTEVLSRMNPPDELDILTGLGNGYSTAESGSNPLLLGGGVGVPPLFNLCKKLYAEGKEITAVLGFNKSTEVFAENEFKKYCKNVIVTTADGSYGIKGFVTDAIKDIDYSYFYTCGPEPMLKAVYSAAKTSGQLSFEERMGCGFGACMGCSCKTKYGNRRICKDGPVLYKEEIIW